jgi:hypothetical protein
MSAHAVSEDRHNEIVTAQDELKFALRTLVGPWLRSRGFKGSGTTWRLRSDRDDFAIVNVQTSQFSTREELICAVNLAVAPEPWLAWEAFRTRPGIDPKYLLRTDPIKPHAEGIWSGRLLPSANTSGSQWWTISDSTSATAAAVDMIRRLELWGLPHMMRLMDRDTITQMVRDAEGSGFGFNRNLTLAVLLSDQGTSPNLDTALAAVEADAVNINAHSRAELLQWSRLRVGERDRQ